MKKLFWVLLVFVFIPISGYGATNASRGTNTSHSAHEQINRQKTMQKQMQKGKNKQTTQSQGQNVTSGFQKSHSKRQNFSFSFQKTVNLTTIFYPAVQKVEQMGIAPFRQCKLISRPPTAKTLGISYTDGGIVDMIKKQWLESLAEQGSNYHCPNCIFYARCGVFYGAVLQRAAQNMLHDLAKFGIVRKAKNGFRIEKLSIADLQNLAVAEIVHTLKRPLYSIPRNWRNARVRLAKSISGYIVYTKDGYAVQVAVAPFSILYSGVTWLAPGEFGGIVANIQANAGESVENAIANTYTKQKYKNKARQIVAYLNTLKSKGYTIQYLQSELSQLQVLLSANSNFLSQEK